MTESYRWSCRPLTSQIPFCAFCCLPSCARVEWPRVPSGVGGGGDRTMMIRCPPRKPLCTVAVCHSRVPWRWRLHGRRAVMPQLRLSRGVPFLVTVKGAVWQCHCRCVSYLLCGRQGLEHIRPHAAVGERVCLRSHAQTENCGGCSAAAGAGAAAQGQRPLGPQVLHVEEGVGESRTRPPGCVPPCAWFWGVYLVGLVADASPPPPPRPPVCVSAPATPSHLSLSCTMGGLGCVAQPPIPRSARYARDEPGPF